MNKAFVIDWLYMCLTQKITCLNDVKRKMPMSTVLSGMNR